MQSDVLGCVNHTHTSAAQLFNDAAVRDGPADHSLPDHGTNLRVECRSTPGARQRSGRQTSRHRSVGCIEITVRLARRRLPLSDTGGPLAACIMPQLMLPASFGWTAPEASLRLTESLRCLPAASNSSIPSSTGLRSNWLRSLPLTRSSTKWRMLAA